MRTVSCLLLVNTRFIGNMLVSVQKPFYIAKCCVLLTRTDTEPSPGSYLVTVVTAVQVM